MFPYNLRTLNRLDTIMTKEQTDNHRVQSKSAQGKMNSKFA